MGAAEKVDQIMTIEECAAYTKFAVATLYRWSCQGLIPCTKLNGGLRFPRPWIDAWILERAKKKSDKEARRHSSFQTRFQSARTRLRSLKTESTEKSQSEKQQRG
jgi:predicted DNA-binding transcriptional regulator AlpA